jgi:malate dehydrogenase (oxaloacetate-decarboxylating)
MKVAAAYALSEIIPDEELNEDYIIPKPFDPRVAPSVAKAVAKAAIESGVARIKVSPEEIASRTVELVKKANRKNIT